MGKASVEKLLVFAKIVEVDWGVLVWVLILILVQMDFEWFFNYNYWFCNFVGVLNIREETLLFVEVFRVKFSYF